MNNSLSVNLGFPANMKPDQLAPMAVVEVYVDGKQQNVLIIQVEKFAASRKEKRYFMAVNKDGSMIRMDQTQIIRLVNHSLTLQ